LPPLQHLLHK